MYATLTLPSSEMTIIILINISAIMQCSIIGIHGSNYFFSLAAPHGRMDWNVRYDDGIVFVDKPRQHQTRPESRRKSRGAVFRSSCCIRFGTGQRTMAVHAPPRTQTILLGGVLDCEKERTLLEIRHARFLPFRSERLGCTCSALACLSGRMSVAAFCKGTRSGLLTDILSSLFDFFTDDNIYYERVSWTGVPNAH